MFPAMTPSSSNAEVRRASAHEAVIKKLFQIHGVDAIQRNGTSIGHHGLTE